MRRKSTTPQRRVDPYAIGRIADPHARFLALLAQQPAPVPGGDVGRLLRGGDAARVEYLEAKAREIPQGDIYKREKLGARIVVLAGQCR